MITREKALACHAGGRPGKLKVARATPTEIQEDFSPRQLAGKPLTQGEAIRARLLPNT